MEPFTQCLKNWLQIDIPYMVILTTVILTLPNSEYRLCAVQLKSWHTRFTAPMLLSNMMSNRSAAVKIAMCHPTNMYTRIRKRALPWHGKALDGYSEASSTASLTCASHIVTQDDEFGRFTPNHLGMFVPRVKYCFRTQTFFIAFRYIT